MVYALNNYAVKTTIFNPQVNPVEVMREYGLECHSELDLNGTSLRAERSKLNNASPHQQYDAIVLGVAHKEFLKLDLNPLKKETAVVYDVKGVLEMAEMKL